jgi:hypothetical protein
MNSPKTPPKESVPESGVQHGNGRSKAKDDALKRVIKQHPQRDKPRVENIEEEAPPSPAQKS